ncbi:MAG: efflux RND transporter permease subunit [Pirellulales bacterium]|nr:efflux RND transporter permease subunit [Pirellulales bacterium]
MKLSDQAVDHPRIVLALTALVMLCAVMSAMLIPIQRTPAIHTAIVMVAVPYPGAQPIEVEEQITRKIERALERLNNVDFVVSTSMRGSSVTQIVFLDGVDSDKARNDVEHLINEVRRELPLGREVQPSVNVIDFESMPIMLVNLTAADGFDERSLKQIAEEVQDNLKTIHGVANTQLFGGRQRELHVNFDPDLLVQYGLSIDELRRTLQGFHAPMPGGSLNAKDFDLNVRSETKFRNVNDIRTAVIREKEGRLITVADVADVSDTYQRLTNVAQLDGLNSATIIVNKESDINSLATANAIKARVAELALEYPHIHFSCTRDVSQEIAYMFQSLGSDAIFGSLVVLIVLAWTMGLRTALLVIMAIPFAAAVSLVFLYLFGFAISNMVIFAYIVSGGMVIDGAIIVADAIYRHLEMGEHPREAAKKGVREVAVPVFAADVVTVAAFLPMVLVPGIMGDFLGVLPIVVAMSLAGSLIVDHFLVPVVAAWAFRNYVPPTIRTAEDGGEAGGMWGPFYHGYERILRWSLARPWYVMSTCAIAVAWASAMLYFGFIGFTFFPPSDRGQFEISFNMPLGSSIEQTAAAADAVALPLADLQETGELVHFVTAVGSSAGLASRLENDPAMGPEFGRVMVELVHPSARKRHQNEIVEEVRSKIRPIPGMEFHIDQIEEGPPGGADVAVRLTGRDLDRLGTMAKQMVEMLKKVPGTVEARTDYRPDNPGIVIEPRPDVVGLYQMTEADVARSIQTAILGDTAIQLPIDDEDITLRLQAKPEFQRNRTDMKNLMLVSSSGRFATVDELADVRRENGLFSVNRRDHDRAVTVMCDVRKDMDVIPDHIFEKIRKEILPEFGFRPAVGNRMAFLGQGSTASEGLRAAFTGENEERDKGFYGLLRSMIIGFILIIVILIIEFNSLRQTMVVMATVPLSFVGVVLGMWLCDFHFSLASFIGLISLTGVVVNDAIVLVDFANDARRRGMSLDEALVEAGTKRSRAVLLTMLTSVGGMLPTFFNLSGGGEFWQPLVGAIIFGLIVSAVLTLIVIPVAYRLVYRRSERRAMSAPAAA